MYTIFVGSPGVLEQLDFLSLLWEFDVLLYLAYLSSPLSLFFHLFVFLKFHLLCFPLLAAFELSPWAAAWPHVVTPAVPGSGPGPPASTFSSAGSGFIYAAAYSTKCPQNICAFYRSFWIQAGNESIRPITTQTFM